MIKSNIKISYSCIRVVMICIVSVWQNFASRAVLEALGSCLNNKYSEGYPGARCLSLSNAFYVIILIMVKVIV